MTIKQILENANRFEDVSDAINHIIFTIDDRSYPVNPIIRDNSITNRVDGKSIKEEATEFLKLINNPSDSIEDTIEKYENLLAYVESESDMMLHNYAISISHKREPHDDMELIRVLLIIKSLIWWLNNDGDYEFDIPDGWKGVNKDA